MNENNNKSLDLSDDALNPHEPETRLERQSCLLPDQVVGGSITPLQTAVDAEMAALEAENQEADESETDVDQDTPSPHVNRRSAFHTLGVLVVWYYVYKLVHSLVINEVDASERGLVIVFIVLMALANTYLTYNTVKMKLREYKARKESSDL